MRAVGHEFLHRLREQDDFVDREPAGEAGEAAAVAAFRRIDLAGNVQRDAEIPAILLTDLARHLAVEAELPNQPLGEEGAHGGGDEERLHAHVDEPADAAHGVVCVERGENQVTGERGADRDFRGLKVPDFPDHHDVRIRPQDGAQRRGEGQADLVFHGDLHHAGELVFHRVLDGDDSPLRVVYLGEEGIEAGGFPRSGRAGDEDDAVGKMEQRLDFLEHERLHAELGDVEFLLVQEPQGNAFALDGGHRGDADVDRRAFELQVDPSVLRHAALGNVEPGHDLQTGDHRALQRLDVFRHGDLDQAAVDPVADPQIRAERLDVDVRRALVERFADDLVDEFDDAGLFVVVLVDDVGLVFAAFEVVVVEIATFENLLEGVRADAVKPAERVVQPLAGGHAPIDRQG